MRRVLFFIQVLILFFSNFSIAQNKQFPSKVSQQFYIENKGQWDNNAAYLTRIGGLDGWILKDGGMLLDFYKTEGTKTLDKFSDISKDEIKKGHPRRHYKW